MRGFSSQRGAREASQRRLDEKREAAREKRRRRRQRGSAGEGEISLKPLQPESHGSGPLTPPPRLERRARAVAANSIKREGAEGIVREHCREKAITITVNRLRNVIQLIWNMSFNKPSSKWFLFMTHPDLSVISVHRGGSFSACSERGEDAELCFVVFSVTACSYRLCMSWYSLSLFSFSLVIL